MKIVTGIQVQVNGMVTVKLYPTAKKFIKSIGTDTPFEQDVAISFYLKGVHTDYFKNKYCRQYEESQDTFFFTVPALRELVETPNIIIIIGSINWEQAINRFMIKNNVELTDLHIKYHNLLSSELKQLHQCNAVLLNDKLKTK